MIFQNAELYNVAELVPTKQGYELYRIPEATRSVLCERSRTLVANSCDGVEIRFVLLGEKAVIRLNMPDLAENAFAPVILYFGSIQGGWLPWLGMRNLHQGLNELEIVRPRREAEMAKRAADLHQAFQPCVIRVRLASIPHLLLGIEGAIRPPQPEEVPALHGLFYGSSITHGSLSMLPNQTYAALCADALHADIENFGMAGACFLEKAMADYFASRQNIQFFLAELGTNIFGGIPNEEFAARVEYLLDAFRATHPATPVFLIDILSVKDCFDDCRRIVREIAEKRADPQLFYFCGRDLLESEEYISADFVHPSADGQRKIAEQLLPVLKKQLR